MIDPHGRQRPMNDAPADTWRAPTYETRALHMRATLLRSVFLSSGTSSIGDFQKRANQCAVIVVVRAATLHRVVRSIAGYETSVCVQDGGARGSFHRHGDRQEAAAGIGRRGAAAATSVKTRSERREALSSLTVATATCAVSGDWLRRPDREHEPTGAVRCGVVRYGATRRGSARQSATRRGSVSCGGVRCAVQCGAARCLSRVERYRSEPRITGGDSGGVTKDAVRGAEEEALGQRWLVRQRQAGSRVNVGT